MPVPSLKSPNGFLYMKKKMQIPHQRFTYFAHSIFYHCTFFLISILLPLAQTSNLLSTLSSLFIQFSQAEQHSFCYPSPLNFQFSVFQLFLNTESQILFFSFFIRPPFTPNLNVGLPVIPFWFTLLLFSDFLPQFRVTKYYSAWHPVGAYYIFLNKQGAESCLQFMIQLKRDIHTKTRYSEHYVSSFLPYRCISSKYMEDEKVAIE